MRPSKHETFLDIAEVLSRRSTCSRRGVGCVLVDRHFRILSCGYNGLPSGFGHCLDGRHDCPARSSGSGKDLDGCHAIHAEINALMFCPDITRIHGVYVTVTPCIQCVKALLNTSAKFIMARKEYPHEEPKNLWTTEGHRAWGLWAENSPTWQGTWPHELSVPIASVAGDLVVDPETRRTWLQGSWDVNGEPK